MLPRHQPDRILVCFDDHRLVANAGLLLTATLGPCTSVLSQLVQQRLALGDAPGLVNTGRTACALDCVVKARATLGTFLRSFRWCHVRQLDRVSR